MDENIKCKFAPEGIDCQNCPNGIKDAPMGHYANGCEVLEVYLEAQMELIEEND